MKIIAEEDLFLNYICALFLIYLRDEQSKIRVHLVGWISSNSKHEK